MHIPGIDNVNADALSRNFNDSVEWSLSPSMFRAITGRLGMPDVDMFASRLNHMVPRFFSWRPDPACEAVNAFSQSWHGVVGYAFPPF